MAVATTKKTENTFTVFRRQVTQTGAYEPAEASCSVTITVDGDMAQDAIAEQIAEWGNTLEMANYEALGIGYEITEQGIRRLDKSVPGNTASTSVAAAVPGPAPRSAPIVGGSPMGDFWTDLMNNQSGWWPPNWEKKLDPEANFNKKGPDYKRRGDGKGIWLTKPDGSSQVPDWFVCPFTGKTAAELASIGSQIRG
jgi:hypothetical protein|tara:strand:- start:12872 stop:13459 length:588 start_codon:yes stop_codon:yes gene_type:complete